MDSRKVCCGTVEGGPFHIDGDRSTHRPAYIIERIISSNGIARSHRRNIDLGHGRIDEGKFFYSKEQSLNSSRISQCSVLGQIGIRPFLQRLYNLSPIRCISIELPYANRVYARSYRFEKRFE